ncbi:MULTISPECIES: hypothetical protein [Pseudidiomarina]|nr:MULTISPECIES: hypothetical protein [Pseudidiomarina]
MTNLTLVDYFKWVFRHWLLTLSLVGLGALSAYTYVNMLPKVYRSSVIFTLNPAAYHQGILREVDDSVIGGHTAKTSEALTRRPEVRFAFYASSMEFAERVAKTLYAKSPKVDEFFQSQEEFTYFVKQYLDYYRFQLDELHIIHWHNLYRAGLVEELKLIVSELNTVMLEQLIAELTSQKEKLGELFESATDPSFQEVISLQLTIVNTRLSLLTTSDFKLINYTSEVEAPTGSVFPKRIFVMVTFMLFWMIVGLTGLSSYLLIKKRRQARKVTDERYTF